MVTWLVRHAGHVLQRGMLGADVKTPYIRKHGRNPSRSLAEFGEGVMFMPLNPNHETRPKLEPRFVDGTFLGITDIGNKAILWSHGKIVEARTIWAKPESERWKASEVLSVTVPEVERQPRGDPGWSGEQTSS